jgi:hypothetical protein
MGEWKTLVCRTMALAQGMCSGVRRRIWKREGRVGGLGNVSFAGMPFAVAVAEDMVGDEDERVGVRWDGNGGEIGREGPDVIRAERSALRNPPLDWPAQSRK